MSEKYELYNYAGKLIASGIIERPDLQSDFLHEKTEKIKKNLKLYNC